MFMVKKKVVKKKVVGPRLRLVEKPSYRLYDAEVIIRYPVAGIKASSREDAERKALDVCWTRLAMATSPPPVTVVVRRLL